MRILYLTAFYPPDFSSGATMQVQRMATRMAGAGHDVRVFSGAIHKGLADGEIAVETAEGGVPVHWIGSQRWTDPIHDVNWSNPVASEAFAGVLDEFRPEVLHAHTLQTLGAGPVAAALDRGVRTILTMHDMWWWCALLFLVNRRLEPCALVTDAGNCPCARDAPWRTARAEALRGVLDGVDEVLVPSTVMRDLVVANGLDPDRVSVDPNDVDTAQLGDLPAAGRDRQAAGHEQPITRFLFVGGDHPLKGTDVLLAAAAQLHNAGGWTLDAHGVALRPQLAGSPVRFHPAFQPSELGTVLANGDVVIIPSIARESFSITAREALAAGLPVITSDCLGPEEVIDDGRNGLVVPTGDHQALAAAMHALIEDRMLLGVLTDGAGRSDVELRSPDAHAAALAGALRHAGAWRAQSAAPAGRLRRRPGGARGQGEIGPRCRGAGAARRSHRPVRTGRPRSHRAPRRRHRRDRAGRRGNPVAGAGARAPPRQRPAHALRRQ